MAISALALSLGLIACSQSESKTPEVAEVDIAVVEQTAPIVSKVNTPETKSVEQVAQLEDALKKARENPTVDNMSDEDRKLREYRAILMQVGNLSKGELLTCNGVFKQGGAVLCKTMPGFVAEIGGIKTTPDDEGFFVAGFDRDAPAVETVNLWLGEHKVKTRKLKIYPREYDIQRIDGLPPSQVSTFTDKQLAHIKASSARKKVGFASRAKDMGFRDGFTMAVSGTKSSDFGNQRILNGEAKRPHYGVDIAAPEGTPIYAPADGVVSLADNDLYFEGAMVLVDHGQGLISMYLHMSDIDVEAGQKVKRGDQLGAVGAKGRATGPHLCWRLKWRNRNLDPELLTQWPHD